MDSKMSYLVSVEVSQLDNLKLLRDTIREIQTLSAQGATFNVRLNSAVQGDVAQSVATAVEQGVRAGATKAAPGVTGVQGAGATATKVDALIGRLDDLVRIMAGDKPARNPKNKEDGLDDKTKAYLSRLESANTKVASALEFLANRAKKSEPLTREELSTVSGALPPKQRRQLKTALESQGDSATDEEIARQAAEISKLISPRRIANLLKKRAETIERELLKAGIVDAGGASAPQAGLRRGLAAGMVSFDKKNFDDLKSAVTSGIVEGMRQFFKGVPGDPKAGTSSPLGKRTSDVSETEAEFARESLGTSQYSALSATLRRLQGIESEAVQRLNSGKAGSKEQEALRLQVATLRELIQEKRVERAQVAGLIGGGGASARRVEEEYANARALPSSLRAKQFARGGRAIGELTDSEREFVVAAAQERVLGVRGLFDQLPIDGTARNRTNALLLRKEELQKSSAFVQQQLTRPRNDPKITEEIRARWQETLDKNARDIEQIEVDLVGQTNLSANRLVGKGVSAYSRKLADDFAAGKITDEEYRKQYGYLTKSTTQTSQAIDPNSPIREYLTLIPEALAQYVRKTLERYVDEFKKNAGVITPELQQEIARNPLLKAITEQDFDQVVSTTRGLGDQFAIYRNVAGSPVRPLGLPDVDQIDPDQLKRYVEQRISGGAQFALQTEERRAFAEATFAKLAAKEGELTPKDPAFENVQTRRKEFQAELLLGGRLFYADASNNKSIDAGRLLSPEERYRVATGAGTRSPDYVAAKQEERVKAEERSVANLTTQTDKLQRSLKAIEDTSRSLAATGLGPIVDAFKEIGVAIGPLAKNLSVVAGVGGPYGAAAARAASRGVGQQLVEQAKTEGFVDRRQIARQEEAIRKGIVAARASEQAVQDRAFLQAALLARSNDPNAPSIVPKNRNERFADLSDTFQQLRRSQNKQIETADLLQERLSRGLPITSGVRKLEGEQANYAATQGRFARELLSFDQLDGKFFGKAAATAAQEFLQGQDRLGAVGSGVTQIKALLDAESAQVLERDALVTRIDRYKEGRTNLDAVRAQRDTTANLFRDVNARRREAEDLEQRRLNLAAERDRAIAATKAPNLSEDEQKRADILAKQATRRANDAANAARLAANLSDAALNTAANYVGLEYKPSGSGIIGKAIDPKTGLELAGAEVQQRLGKRLEDENTDVQKASVIGVSKASAIEAERLLGQIDARLADVRQRAEAARKALETTTGKPVIAQQQELNKLLREEVELQKARGDALLQATDRQFKSAQTASKIFSEFKNKLENLTEYVLAGGVVYTIASQLRQAGSTAVGAEADLTRIQGVLTGRSREGRQDVRAGILQAATDYGTPLQQSIQAAKLFAQTGADAGRTVELTRASLAAQVGAGLEAGQATEFLIASENITQGRVKPFDVLDRISRIESQYAVSAQDLSQAIQRAGSIATQLQPAALGSVDALDTVIGAATAIIERTRVSGNQAATSLRFIFSRLAAPEVAAKLQNQYGIALAGKEPGELRPLQDILSDIADKYKEFSDPSSESYNTVRAQQLLVSFAGARQVNAAAALLDNFNYAMSVATESSLAFGDTQARVNLQLQTTETAYTQFQTALAGFAQRALEEGGLGFVAKSALGAGTKFFQNNGALGTGLVTSGIVGGLGYAASAGSANLSAALNAGVLTAGIARAAPALSGLARIGALAGTAGIALGGIGLAVAGFEAGGRLWKFFSQLGKYQKITDFDTDAFQSSDFFKNYQNTALGFGASAGDFSLRVRNATLTAVENISRTLGPASIQPGYQNRGFAAEAEKQLRAAFRAEFKELEAEPDDNLTAFALEQVRQQFRFEGAPLTFAGEQVTAKVQDLFGTFSKNLEEATNAANFNPRYFQGEYNRLFNAGTGRGDAVSFSTINALRIRSASGSSTSLLDASRGVAAEDRPEAVANFFRENILISQENQLRADRIRVVKAELSAAGKDVSDKAIIAELQKRFAKDFAQLSPVALTALGDVVRRVGNQQTYAQTIADDVFKFVRGAETGQSAVLTQSELLKARPGDVIEQGYTQLFEQTRRELTERLAKATTNEGRELIKTLLGTLESASSRPRQLAELNNRRGGSSLVRERILDPFIQFGQREQQIEGNLTVRRLFGIGFDEQASRAESGVQFVRDLTSIRTNIVGEIGRLGARLAFTDNKEVLAYDLQNAVPESEGGRLLVSDIDALRLVNKEDRQRTELAASQQIAALQQQLQVTYTGFGGFVNATLASPDSSEGQKTGARALQASLAGLLATSKTLKPGDAEAILETSKSLEEIIERVGAFVKPLVAAENRRKLDDVTRALRNSEQQADLKIAQADLEQALSAQAAQLQVLNRPREIFEQAFAGVGAREGQSRREASVALTTALQEAQIAFGRNRDAAAFERERIKAQGEYELAIKELEATSKRSRNQLIAEAETQIATERRGEATQLFDNVASPIKGLLQSEQNFSAEGYRQLFGGVASAFQTQLVDVLAQTFKDSTTGQQIISSFEVGALFTRQAIISGFAEGVAISKYMGADGVFAGGGVAGLTAAQVLFNPETGQLGSIADANFVGSKPFLKGGGAGRLLGAALPVIGTLAGGSIGPPGTYSQEGASILGGIGATFGPVGGLIGGLVGGALGSLFGKDTPKPVESIAPLEKIEQNTREAVQAIEAQTQLMQLDRRFVNIPAGFVLPGYTPFGASGGSGSTVNIVINPQPGQPAELIAEQVVKQLTKQLGVAGQALDIRF